MIIKTDGVANAVNALAYFDKKAYNEMAKGVRAILTEAQTEARALTPPMALVSLSGSGGWGRWNRRGSENVSFDGNTVRGSIKTSVRRRGPTATRSGSVRGLITTKSVPAVIFQAIGRGKDGDSQFSREVINQWGPPESRMVWGAAERMGETKAAARIQVLMEAAAREAQSRINRS